MCVCLAVCVSDLQPLRCIRKVHLKCGSCRISENPVADAWLLGLIGGLMNACSGCVLILAAVLVELGFPASRSLIPLLPHQ